MLNNVFECTQRFVPHLIEVGPEASDSLRVELIETPGSIPDVGHEASFFKDFEVLRDGRPRDGHRTGKLVDGDGAIGKFLEDCHAGGIGKGVQSGL